MEDRRCRKGPGVEADQRRSRQDLNGNLSARRWQSPAQRASARRPAPSESNNWRQRDQAISVIGKGVAERGLTSISPPCSPLCLALASIEDPGPVAERDIEPFLTQGRPELDRQFIQHGLDILIGQMSQIGMDGLAGEDRYGFAV
jgi:hypothetical protein